MEITVYAQQDQDDRVQFSFGWLIGSLLCFLFPKMRRNRSIVCISISNNVGLVLLFRENVKMFYGVRNPV